MLQVHSQVPAVVYAEFAGLEVHAVQVASDAVLQPELSKSSPTAQSEASVHRSQVPFSSASWWSVTQLKLQKPFEREPVSAWA
jgi:hypothetical protein